MPSWPICAFGVGFSGQRYFSHHAFLSFEASRRWSQMMMFGGKESGWKGASGRQKTGRIAVR